MQKCFSTLLILVLSISFIGCSAQKEPTMELTPATLTAEETKILQLAGYPSLDDVPDYAIFDYHIDDTIKSFSIICYELDKTGNWTQMSGGGSMPLEVSTGRISISFHDTVRNGIQMALQEGKNIFTGKNNFPEKISLEGMQQSTVYAALKTIEPEKEIPLALQVITSKMEESLSDVSSFHQPKMYQEKGYEHVYAVTIKFSKTILQ